MRSPISVCPRRYARPSSTVRSSCRTELTASDPAAVRSTPLLNEVDRLRVLRAYSNGFRTIFIVLAILTALACVIAQLLIQQRSLKRDEDAELKRQGRAWLAARKQAAPAPASEK